MTLRVKIARDVTWSWDDGPRYRLHDMSSVVKLDPTPCYQHDAQIVRTRLALVDKAWPHEGAVTYHLGQHEGVDRANGLTATQWGKGGVVAGHHVFLAGKRIPPHHAITNYLVAHEYGHCVDDWIAKRQGVDTDAMLDDYARRRGLNGARTHGGAGTWHSATAEVFACDFRILVADVEAAYWPHPGIPYPTKVRGLARWWGRAQP